MPGREVQEGDCREPLLSSMLCLLHCNLGRLAAAICLCRQQAEWRMGAAGVTHASLLLLDQRERRLVLDPCRPLFMQPAWKGTLPGLQMRQRPWRGS